MPRIDFTQYLMPHGRAKPVSVDRPDDVYQKARELIRAGYHFEIEMLSTGDVHMDCSRDGSDEPLANELCANGPDVPPAVDRLVDTAWRAAGLAPASPRRAARPGVGVAPSGPDTAGRR